MPGFSACRILGIRYSRIAKLMDKFKGEMEASILKKAENLDRLGYEGYVDSKSHLMINCLNMLMDQIQNNNNDNIKNPSYRVI